MVLSRVGRRQSTSSVRSTRGLLRSGCWLSPHGNCKPSWSLLHTPNTSASHLSILGSCGHLCCFHLHVQQVCFSCCPHRTPPPHQHPVDLVLEQTEREPGSFRMLQWPGRSQNQSLSVPSPSLAQHPVSDHASQANAVIRGTWPLSRWGSPRKLRFLSLRTGCVTLDLSES